MNYNQNKKIAQITSQTLIIGVDIAKFKHVARAQDFRGIEFGSPCYWLIRRISKKVRVPDLLCKRAQTRSVRKTGLYHLDRCIEGMIGHLTR